MPYQILVPNSEIDKSDVYGTYTDIDDGESHDSAATVISCMILDPSDGYITVGFTNPTPMGTITSVELHIVGRIDNLAVDVGYVTPYIGYVVGDDYYGIGGSGYYAFPNTSFTEFSKTWAISPHTGVAWTWSDLTDLTLYMEMSINVVSGSHYVDVTSAYLKINHTNSPSSSGQIIGFGW